MPTFQIGLAVQILSLAIYMVLAVLLYRLLRPADDRVALVALVFALLGAASQSISSVVPMAMTALVGSAKAAETLSPSQAVVLAATSTAAMRVALLFFAGFDLAIGYLLLRSGLLHPAFGGFMVVAGVAWLSMAYPPLGSAIAPLVVAVGGGAEVALMLRLLILGTPAQLAVYLAPDTDISWITATFGGEAVFVIWLAIFGWRIFDTAVPVARLAAVERIAS